MDFSSLTWAISARVEEYRGSNTSQTWFVGGYSLELGGVLTLKNSSWSFPILLRGGESVGKDLPRYGRVDWV